MTTDLQMKKLPGLPMSYGESVYLQIFGLLPAHLFCQNTTENIHFTSSSYLSFIESNTSINNQLVTQFMEGSPCWKRGQLQSLWTVSKTILNRATGLVCKFYTSIPGLFSFTSIFFPGNSKVYIYIYIYFFILKVEREVAETGFNKYSWKNTFIQICPRHHLIYECADKSVMWRCDQQRPKR